MAVKKNVPSADGFCGKYQLSRRPDWSGVCALLERFNVEEKNAPEAEAAK